MKADDAYWRIDVICFSSALQLVGLKGVMLGEVAKLDDAEVPKDLSIADGILDAPADYFTCLVKT